MQVNGQTTVEASHVIVPPVRSKKKIIPPPMDLTIVNTMDESNKEGSALPAWDVSGICCLKCKCKVHVKMFCLFLIRYYFFFFFLFCLSICHYTVCQSTAESWSGDLQSVLAGVVSRDH